MLPMEKSLYTSFEGVTPGHVHLVAKGDRAQQRDSPAVSNGPGLTSPDNG